MRCLRREAVGDRFGAAIAVATVPDRRFLYRIALAQPGRPVLQRLSIRTFTE